MLQWLESLPIYKAVSFINFIIVSFFKNFKVLCLICFILIFSNRQLWGATTGVLYGRVTDKKTGNPLPFVNVMILESKQGAATDIKGRYKINNIRAGIYTVRITMMGYGRVQYKDIKIIQDHMTRLDVALEKITIEGEIVEITSERPVIQTDVTGTENYIEGDKIMLIPVSQIQDVLGLQPGTTMEGNIRGGKIREVSYMIDGVASSDAISGGLGVNIPLSAVQQVNVITGGFSAEYGNALSGVVNVVTKNGSDKNKFLLRIQKDDLFGGTEISKNKQMELSVSGPLKKGKAHYFLANNLNLSGTRWWQDMQYFFPMPVDKSINGIGKIDIAFSPSKRLILQTMYSAREWRDYEFSWRYNLDGLPKRWKKSVCTALIWNHNVTKNFFYTIHLSHSYISEKIGEGNPDSTIADPFRYDFFLLYVIGGKRMWWADMAQQIWSVKNDFTLQYKKNHMIQAGWELNAFDISSNIRKLEPHLSYFGKPLIHEPLLDYSSVYHYYPSSGNIYIQDKIEAGKEGSVINMGVRFSFLDPRANRPAVELIPTEEDEYQEEITGYIPASVKWTVSPRFGYSFPLSDKTYFFLNYGHYVQYPLFNYLYSGLHNVQLQKGISVLRGNPDLLPEKTKSWEVSIRREVAKYLAVSLTYFHKETTNQIDTKTFVPSNSRIAGDYGFAEYINNPYATARGFELTLSRTKGEFITGTISYCWMTAKGLSDYENQALNYAQWGFPVANLPFYLSWDQRHTVTANVAIDLPFGVRSNIVYKYHTGRPYTYFPSKDGFTPDNPDMLFVPNNRRMPSNQFLNVKMYRNFSVTSLFLKRVEMGVKLYVDIRNVFDAQNVRWIDASGRIGGELRDPSAYYIGRRINTGIEIEF